MPNAVKKCEHYEKFKVYRDKILALHNDSLEKTIAIALSLCLLCAVLVSFAAVALKPLQIDNKELDMKKNILDVAGLLDADTDINQAFDERIEAKLVDIETGDYVENMDVAAYDQRKAAKDPAQRLAIPSEKDIASIRAKAKIAKVYLVKKDDAIQSCLCMDTGYGRRCTVFFPWRLMGKPYKASTSTIRPKHRGWVVKLSILTGVRYGMARKSIPNPENLF
jgi:Na+-transporting NADH:ubiquinone oxidoreductase subunit C